MRPLPDRLNDWLERQRRDGRPARPAQSAIPGADPEVEELARLARRLQTAPQLRVDPGFAQRLEARIMAQHAVQSRKKARMAWGNEQLQRAPWKRVAIGIALACLFVAGTVGTLSAAAQVTNPNNPLYTVKLWEQRVQHPQSDATVGQAETNWRKADKQLNTLANLTGPAHAATYRQNLADLEQQINRLAQSIQALPAGPDKDNLTNKLATLKANARQTLRGLLPRLGLSEQLLTTDELGRLGDTVPNIDSVAMVVAHPQKQATITITGDNLQTSAQLVMDNQLMIASSTWQNRTGVFIVSWSGKESPKTIGILNPDGTAAQTTTITFTLTERNGNNNNNGNGNTNTNSNNDNGNTNNNGNNGNGNNNGSNSDNANNNGKGKGKGKATATPTPTPTPTATP